MEAVCKGILFHLGKSVLHRQQVGKEQSFSMSGNVNVDQNSACIEICPLAQAFYSRHVKWKGLLIPGLCAFFYVIKRPQTEADLPK